MPRCRVVGRVEAERTEPSRSAAVLTGADELELVSGLGGGKSALTNRTVRSTVSARAPARLHGELLPGTDDRSDDFAGPDSGGAVENLPVVRSTTATSQSLPAGPAVRTLMKPSAGAV